MNQRTTNIFCTTALVFTLSFLPIFAQTSRAARRPDPVVATLISLGTTLIPLAMGAVLWTQERGIDEGLRYDLGFVFFGVGGIIGPSSGKFYADKESDAWVSLSLRGLTGTMGLAGCGLWLRGEDAQTRNNGRALAAIGISTTGLLALYDIWTSGSAALETQRQRGYGPGTSQLLHPTTQPFPNRLTKRAVTEEILINRMPLPRPQLHRPAKQVRLLTSKPLFSSLAPQW